MSENEKKAIEYLTKFTEYTRKNSKKQHRFDIQYAKDLEKRVEMFETALNLIQKQQAEIEKKNILYHKTMSELVKADKTKRELAEMVFNSRNLTYVDDKQYEEEITEIIEYAEGQANGKAM